MPVQRRLSAVLNLVCHVESSRERASIASDQQHFHGVVGSRPGDMFAQLVDDLAVNGVELVGTVEGDGGNRARCLVQDDVGHGCCSFLVGGSTC
jgi:hypothetical protein